MALIKPFAAVRPKPELADKICELPYDVMSSEEARAMAAGNPFAVPNRSCVFVLFDSASALFWIKMMD
jgi:uncharacterized protein (DUF1015 family)